MENKLINPHRTALFIDGKDFYVKWRDNGKNRLIDFQAMTRWVVEKAGGHTFVSAHYFTDVDEEQKENQAFTADKLPSFLDMLVHQPGFSLHRTHRKISTTSCDCCGKEHTFTSDKENALTLASEILYLAAVDAFDTAVLVTTDEAYVPLLQHVHTMGKRIHIAAWGKLGMSNPLRGAAFSFIDLFEGQNTFIWKETAQEILPFTQQRQLNAFLSEILAASNQFKGGFVGVEYFLNNWRSPHLENSCDQRRGLLNQLLIENWVEIYPIENGDLAVRLADRGMERLQHLNDDKEAQPSA